MSQFKYLGITFTTRLSASHHIDHIISKCESKIGILFSYLPLKQIPISIAINVFNTYVLPILTYGSSVWFPWCADSYIKKINAVYTKFLKRCCCLPFSTNNAITHYITNSSPICIALNNSNFNGFYSTYFPAELTGTKLKPPNENSINYSPIAEIPSFFWSAPIISLPNMPVLRRAVLYDALDIHHFHYCKTRKFHLSPEEDCICQFCNQTINYYYHYRQCPRTKNLSSCARLKLSMLSKSQNANQL